MLNLPISLPRALRQLTGRPLCSPGVFVLLVAATCTTHAAHASAQIPCRYDVLATLGPPNCGPLSGGTTATAISPDGRIVVGYRQCALGGPQPFKWTLETGVVNLPLPPWLMEAIPADVNDHGLMVGQGNGFTFGQRGFICDLNTGVWTELLPQNPPTGWSGASAISRNGLVCGYRSLDDGGDPVNPQTATLWNSDGSVVRDFGLIRGHNTNAHDVNDDGLVCVSDGYSIDPGRRGYLWFATSITPIDFVPGGVSSHIDDLIPNGWSIVSGIIQHSPQISAAYVRRADGVLMPLQAFPGSSGPGPVSMNSLGVAAGRSDNKACIWRNGEIIEVKTLLPQPFNGSLKIAMISEDQTLVCNGSSLAYVLNPVFGMLGDSNCDQAVNSDDLMATISQWGECAGCTADANGDLLVNVSDLVEVIVHWTR